MPTTPTLLLTRPAGDNERTLAALRQAGLPDMPVVLSPLLQICLMDVGIDTGWPATLIFTSKHGVAAYHSRPRPALPCYVVGSRTAAAAQTRGHPVIGAYRNAAEFLALSSVTGPVLHVRGQHARSEIAKTLSSRGVDAREVVTYCQNTMPLSPDAKQLTKGEQPVVVPLFSPRSAAQFCKAWSGPAKMYGVGLSTAVAEAAAPIQWAKFRVAPEPTLASLVTSLVDMVQAEPG